jgi:hypothetical protein
MYTKAKKLQRRAKARVVVLLERGQLTGLQSSCDNVLSCTHVLHALFLL